MFKLLIPILLLLTNLSYAKVYRTALVIGNSAYHDSPLANPKHDAEDIAKALKTLGFKVILRVDASLREMDEAVITFGKTLEKNKGVGLFFYAGHGIQSNGRNYLIPINSGLKRESDLKYNALDAGKVLDEMGYANNNLNIAILDACRNNPLSRSFRSGRRGLARPNDVPSGTLIAYSTAPGKQAADGQGRNSPYTKALLKSIKEKGQPLEIVFKNVIKAVKSETGGKQIPWVSSSVDGDFYFSGKLKNKKEILPVEKISTTSPVIVSNEKFEILYWESVVQSPTAEKYRAYLDKYPKGHFNLLAISELNLLEKKNNLDSSRQISINIDKCAKFIKSMNLTTGSKGNALSCYKNILSKNPDDKKAIKGIRLIEKKYIELIKSNLKQKNTRKASAFIAKLEKVNPHNFDLPSLKKQYELNVSKSIATSKMLSLVKTKPVKTKPAKIINIAEKDNSISISKEQQQVYVEYKEIIEELLENKNYKKAEKYLQKLININPSGSEIEHFQKRIAQKENIPNISASANVILAGEELQIFEEYQEVVEDILDTDRLTDKEANKIRKYIAKLKNISPTSPVIEELNTLYLSKLK